MKTAQIKLELKQLELVLNAIAQQYNYVTAKPLIDEIERQLKEQIGEEKESAPELETQTSKYG